MKNIKKLLSIVMVLAMVLALGVNAFATNVTITDSDKNSTYTAYPLLTATYNEGTKLYQYTLNDTYLDAIKAGLTAAGKETIPVNGVETAIEDLSAEDGDAIVEAISKIATKGEDIRKFADAAFGVIQKSEAMKNAGVKSTGKEFTNLNGYYLIAETVSDDDEGNATSLVMLNTIGAGESITITTKEDHPSSDKKVKETNDTAGSTTDWQDGADYDIGDYIPYQLTATISDAYYADYETYYLQFVDELSKGLTFVNDDEHPVKVTVNGTDITDSFVISEATAGGTYPEGTKFTVTCADLKDVLSVSAGDTIVVTYYAQLNGDAVIGEAGNPNKSHIVYSNNPYGEGNGHTPDDIVTVFTFTIEAKKVNGADEPLEGAGFTLLKRIPSLPADAVATKYEDLKDAEVGAYYQAGGNTYQVVHEEIADVTTFEFKGQDSGEYLLVETTVPTGYNKAADIEITVEATYDTDSDHPALKTLTVTPAEAGFTAELSSGKISGKVVNLTGATLPETGGIGTTIFYVVGAILVVGAVILLVTKRRMTGAEK